jgi:beta-barrel assembly-enhancing protease
MHDRNQKRYRVLTLSARLPLFAALVSVAAASELNFRPGFNLFSLSQEVEVGRENVALAVKQVPVLLDDTVTRYVNALGRRLHNFAPNNQPDYVWQFTVLNSGDVNAFALPGGYIFVNRATIEAAQNEAQLAGVLAHEEGHVVLRHGTHQLSETMLAQAPLGLFSSMLGQDDSFARKVVEYVGAGVLEGALLKNSRSMEAQADAVGAYILYQAGYDPHALPQFFEIIKQDYPADSCGSLSFFADHPDPGNRAKAVGDEIPELGPAKAWTIDALAFRDMKSHLLSLPPPPKSQREAMR